MLHSPPQLIANKFSTRNNVYVALQLKSRAPKVLRHLNSYPAASTHFGGTNGVDIKMSCQKCPSAIDTPSPVPGLETTYHFMVLCLHASYLGRICCGRHTASICDLQDVIPTSLAGLEMGSTGLNMINSG